MPLILAIEPDRRQASQLTAMVRGRLHAELVLGESAERALAALGQRVPDLILTSALLSPKDENALGERLRALDGAAAHVQTLTIPVLASTSGRGAGRAGGVLSALRRDKAKASATPEGCDPGVFADQCKEYLERAATERAAFAEQAATAALDAQADLIARSPAPEPVVVRPASNRESRKARAEHQSIVLPPEPEEFAVEPAEVFHAVVPEPVAESYSATVSAPTDPYVASAPETIDPPHVEEALPEPVVKRKGQKAGKRRPPQGIRSVLGLTQDESDGPASLLAAVAALEAEEHVEPIVAPTAGAVPIVETPVFEAPIAAAPSFEPSIIRPPVVDSMPTLSAQLADDARRAATPAEQPPADELLDLSSLLDRSSSAPTHRASTFSDEPVVEVYELDNSLLSTPFDEVVRSTPASDPFTTTSIVNSTRGEGRSWPVLDTLIAETAAFQAAAPSSSSTSSSPMHTSAAPSEVNEVKPLGDILEALRRDAEQLPAAPAAQSFALPEIVASPEAEARSGSDVNPPDAPADDDEKKKKKKSKASPAQDEWGFFDPDQCGFAALIEKLEEITDKDDTPAPRRA